MRIAHLNEIFVDEQIDFLTIYEDTHIIFKIIQMGDKEEQEEQVFQVDEEVQVEMEGLINWMENAFSQLHEKLKYIKTKQNQEHQLLNLDCKLLAQTQGKFEQLIKKLITSLVQQDMTFPPSLRANFYKLISNNFCSYIHINRYDLLNVALNGFDIEMKPSDAIEELIQKIRVWVDKFLSLQKNEIGEVFNKHLYLVVENQYHYITKPEIKNLPQQSYPYIHSYKQTVLYTYFLYNYIRKASKALSPKSISSIYDGIKKLIPKLIQMHTRIFRQIIIHQEKDINSYTCMHAWVQLTLLNQELFQLKQKWDWFFIPISLLKQIEFPSKSEQQSNYFVFLLDLLQQQNQYMYKKTVTCNNLTPYLLCLIRYYNDLCNFCSSLPHLHFFGQFPKLKAKLNDLLSPLVKYLCLALKMQTMLYHQVIELIMLIVAAEGWADGRLLEAVIKGFGQDYQVDWENVKLFFNSGLMNSFEKDILQTFRLLSFQQTEQVMRKLISHSLIRVNKANWQKIKAVVNEYFLESEYYNFKNENGLKQKIWNDMFEIMQKQLLFWNPTLKIDFNNCENYVESQFVKELSKDNLIEYMDNMANIDTAISILFMQQEYKNLMKPPLIKAFTSLLIKFCQTPLLANNCQNLIESLFSSILPYLINQPILHTQEDRLLGRQPYDCKVLKLMLQMCKIMKQIPSDFIRVYQQKVKRIVQEIDAKKLFEDFVIGLAKSRSQFQAQAIKLFEKLFLLQLKNKSARWYLRTHNSLSQLLSDHLLKQAYQQEQLVKQVKQLYYCEKDKDQIVLKNPEKQLQESQMLIVTNPLNVDKKIDQFLINLTRNAVIGLSCLVEFVVKETKVLDKQSMDYVCQLLTTIIKQYPIVTAVLLNLKERESNQIFGVWLGLQGAKLDQRFRLLLLQTLETKCIRFTDGDNYIQLQLQKYLMYNFTKELKQSPFPFHLIPIILHYNKGQLSSIVIKELISLYEKENQINKELLQCFYQCMPKEQEYSEWRKKVCMYRTKEQTVKRKKVDPDLWVMKIQTTYQYGSHSKIILTQVENKKTPSQYTIKTIDLEELPQKTISEQKLFISSKFQKPCFEKYQTIYDPIKYQIFEMFTRKQWGKVAIKVGIQRILELIPKRLQKRIKRQIQAEVNNLKQANIKQQLQKQKYLTTLLKYQDIVVPTLNAQNLESCIIMYVKKEVEFQSFGLNSNNFERVLDWLVIAVCVDPQKIRKKLVEIDENRQQEINKDEKSDKSIRSQVNESILQNFYKQKSEKDLLKILFQFLQKYGKSKHFCDKMSTFTQRLQSTKNMLELVEYNQEQNLFIFMFKNLYKRLLQQEQTQFLNQYHQWIKSFFVRKTNEMFDIYYNVNMDNQTINILLKHLREYPQLLQMSNLIHSNYANQRIYFQQLSEGLKAMNISGKLRTYNQYLKLISKDWKDEEFLIPLQLFKINISFYVTVIKQSYNRGKKEAKKILIKKIRQFLETREKQQLNNQIIQTAIEEYYKEKLNLRNNMIMNYKSIYLTARFRDVFLQNCHTTTYLIPQNNLVAINSIELFTTMIKIYKEIILENGWTKPGRTYFSKQEIQEMIGISTWKRLGCIVYGNMDEYDQIVQGYINNAKEFFIGQLGQKFLSTIDIHPSILLVNNIRNDKHISYNSSFVVEGEKGQIEIKVEDFEKLKKKVEEYEPQLFINKQSQFIFDNNKTSLSQIIEKYIEILKQKMFLQQKSGYLMFNGLKTSQASLDQFQLLGQLISYIIIRKQTINFNLHPIIFNQITGQSLHLQVFSQCDNKIWEHCKFILCHVETKQLNLNFSYEFILNDGTKKRIQLIPKGYNKKLNNLNREEYVDAIIINWFNQKLGLQVNKFLAGLYKIMPKQYFSTLTHQTISSFLKHKSRSFNLKSRLIIPQRFQLNQKIVNNSKDQQIINWLVECIQGLQLDQRKKLDEILWKDLDEEFRCLVVGTDRQVEGLMLMKKKILIKHYQKKEQIQMELIAKIK